MRPFIFIRKNTKELRRRMVDEGFYLCPCAAFEGAIWLDGCVYDGGISVHGVGYADETDEYWDQPPEVVVERVLEDEREHGNPIVDCGEDADKFVSELKRLLDNT